jgi:hypothetical protein
VCVFYFLGISSFSARAHRYIDSCCVEQEGVESLRTMFPQRERWAWGHLQTLYRYVFSKKLWTSRMPLKTKVDSALYLSYIMIPSLVILCWVWSGFNVLGVIPVRNMFSSAFTIGVSFSFFPMLGYGLWKARDDYPVWQIIPLLLITTVYTYHWIPCIVSARAFGGLKFNPKPNPTQPKPKPKHLVGAGICAVSSENNPERDSRLQLIDLLRFKAKICS